MCLSQPAPCNKKEVIAYKLMFPLKSGILQSVQTQNQYEFGKPYEAEPLDEEKDYLITPSPAYDKGFHAYANKKDARSARRGFGNIAIVKVRLTNLTFVESSSLKEYFPKVYVANTCEFLEEVK